MRRTIREEAATSGGLGAVCVELCPARWNVSAARQRRSGQGLERLVFEDETQAALLGLGLGLGRGRGRTLPLPLPLALTPSPNPNFYTVQGGKYEVTLLRRPGDVVHTYRNPGESFGEL